MEYCEVYQPLFLIGISTEWGVPTFTSLHHTPPRNWTLETLFLLMMVPQRLFNLVAVQFMSAPNLMVIDDIHANVN